MDNCVSVPFQKYEDMMIKVQRYNALRNLVRKEIDNGNRYPVRDDLCLALLDLSSYQAEQQKKEKDDEQ